MKYVDTSTVGGRIRISRKKLNLTLEQMGKKLDVSPNYISLIERDKKKPSDKLLAKISIETDVSIEWLRNGNSQNFGTEAKDKSSSQLPGHVENIDASLFLNLVLHETPGLTKETMATILALDEKTLNDVLAGTIKYDPAWETGFANLAQRAEISSILKKLHSIESFLEPIQIKKLDFELIRLFKEALSNKFHDEFVYCSQSRHGAKSIDIWHASFDSTTPERDFIFQQKTTNDTWNIRLYSEMSGSLLQEILFRAKARPDYPDSNSVLVFGDERTISMLPYAQMEALRYIPEPIRQSDKRPFVILMLFDPSSMQITSICDLTEQVQIEGGIYGIDYPTYNKIRPDLL